MNNRSDLLWEDAPIGFVVITVRGKQYRSGPSLPADHHLTEAIRGWMVPVLDKGIGIGRMTKYMDGKPSY